MKKFPAGVPVLLFLILGLSGCNTIGSKSGSLSVIYCTAAVLSFILLIGCIRLVHKKRIWFITLFSSVLIVNIGYTLLSVSTCLEMALWANRLSYLGSVFLPLSMLMIILRVTNTEYHPLVPKILLGLAAAVFLIAASPGILPIYYKEVSFAVVGGVSTLVKDYGPLHPLYLIYLLGYFSAMVAVIIRAQVRNAMGSTSHAIVLAIAVFVNLGVWFIEQLVQVDFEMLSVSYIISELFLLGVHLVMDEHQRLQEIVMQVESVQEYSSEEPSRSEAMLESPIEETQVAPERIEIFVAGLRHLTPTERTIYEAYAARVTTKEIMANLNIKETTLKYHNRNLYGKLGVSNRRELLELHKHIRSVKARIGDADSGTGN